MVKRKDLVADSTTETDIAPWYRQPWFWFVMSPLIVVICVSLSFVAVSVFHADDRVVDNYYKQGRAINQSFAQDIRARELNLNAELRFDRQTGELLLQLQGEGPLPKQLQVLIGHPVNAEADQAVRLTQLRSGYYRGDFTGPLEYRRYLTLMPAEGAEQIGKANWLLRGEIDFKRQDSVRLVPASRAQTDSDSTSR